MIATATCTFLLVSALVQGKAKDLKPPPAAGPARVEWCESYEKGFEEANDRGVALMIAVIEDSEGASDGVRQSILASKEFIERSRHTVNLLANRAADAAGTPVDHGVKEEKRGAETIKACGLFGSVTCAEHKRVEVGVFRDFAHDGILKTPMILITQPDQTIIAKLIDVNPVEAYLEAFAEARKKWPGGLTRAQAEEVRAQLAAGEESLAAGDVEPILKFALPYRKDGGKGRLVERHRGRDGWSNARSLCSRARRSSATRR
jgi:hypothetical protein